MAKVETIDVTTSEGANKFPLETNDIYNMVEKVASQNIRSAKNAVIKYLSVPLFLYNS